MCQDDIELEEANAKTVLAIPVNSKLPWFSIKLAPNEYHSDISEGRNISHRY